VKARLPLIGTAATGTSVSRRTEKVRALRDLLDVETRPAPEPHFATDWPAEPVENGGRVREVWGPMLLQGNSFGGGYATAGLLPWRAG